MRGERSRPGARTPRSEPFYTEFQGKWQLLDNGNLLLTESQAGRVVEVAPDGRSVWEWIAEPYDEDPVPEITEGTRVPWSAERVADWPCSRTAGPGEGKGRETASDAGRGEADA